MNLHGRKMLTLLLQVLDLILISLIYPLTEGSNFRILNRSGGLQRLINQKSFCRRGQGEGELLRRSTEPNIPIKNQKSKIKNVHAASDFLRNFEIFYFRFQTRNEPTSSPWFLIRNRPTKGTNFHSVRCLVAVSKEPSILIRSNASAARAEHRGEAGQLCTKFTNFYKITQRDLHINLLMTSFLSQKGLTPPHPRFVQTQIIRASPVTEGSNFRIRIPQSAFRNRPLAHETPVYRALSAFIGFENSHFLFSGSPHLCPIKKLFTSFPSIHTITSVISNSERPPASDPAPSKPVDPNIQIKFTIIFGILALIPFVLFYFFGVDHKSGSAEGSSTNKIPVANFKEITAQAGIHFSHVNGATGERLLPETMGAGCAFFDMDNDGDQDLLLVNSTFWPWSKPEGKPLPTHALYENDGKGNFKDVTSGSGLDISTYGMGAAIGDFDNDGLPDVFISGVHGNHLFHNLSKGHFQDITQTAGVGGTGKDWSTSCAWFDYDRDGDLDLFVCNYVQWSRETDLSVDYRLPEVGRAYGPPMNFSGSFPYLYRNDRNGKFTEVSSNAGIRMTNKATGFPMAKSLGVSPVDLDNDGWVDLVVANDTVQNFVFHNNHDGTFAEMGGRSGVAYDKFGSTRGAMGVDTARLYNDNALAISIGNFANEMTAFYVSSRDPLVFSDEALDTGIGTPTRTLLTFGIFFFDYDLDGQLDLLTANGHIEPQIQKLHSNQTYTQPAQLFWNNGKGLKQGSFELVPSSQCGEDLYKPISGRGSAYADIDGDGDLDVLITQAEGSVQMFRNEQNLNHNWVRLKLVGTKSNRDAIGAWVKITAGTQTISQQVMPARGYLSSSELPLTIGLGTKSKIDSAQVMWPDGSLQSGIQLKLNSLNTITQP